MLAMTNPTLPTALFRLLRREGRHFQLRLPVKLVSREIVKWKTLDPMIEHVQRAGRPVK